MTRYLTREGCGFSDCGPCSQLASEGTRIGVAVPIDQLADLVAAAARCPDLPGVEALARRILEAQRRRAPGCRNRPAKTEARR